MIGLMLLFCIFAYYVFAFFVYIFAKDLAKNNKQQKMIKWGLILLPFAKIIIVQILFGFFRLVPLSAIHETVEKPISVYWEDNVWPGFSERERSGTVYGLLDGDHLKLLVLNGIDGKYYVYRASTSDFIESMKIQAEIQRLQTLEDQLRIEVLKYPTNERKDHPLRPQLLQNNDNIRLAKIEYTKIKTEEVAKVLSRVEVVDKLSDIPPVNYEVRFDLLPINYLFNNIILRFMHADRISIIDKNKNKEIAYSRRYMTYSWFLKRLSGAPGKFGAILGYESAYFFHNKVLFVYTSGGSGGKNIRYPHWRKRN